MTEVLACIILEVLLLQLAAFKDEKVSPPPKMCDVGLHSIYIMRGYCSYTTHWAQATSMPACKRAAACAHKGNQQVGKPDLGSSWLLRWASAAMCIRLASEAFQVRTDRGSWVSHSLTHLEVLQGAAHSWHWRGSRSARKQERPPPGTACLRWVAPASSAP